MAERYTVISPGGTTMVFEATRISERPNGDLRVKAPDGSVSTIPVSTWGDDGQAPIRAARGGTGREFSVRVDSKVEAGQTIQAASGRGKGRGKGGKRAVGLELSNGFAKRVADREIDLIRLIEDGVPELEYLPGAEGILVKGRRHLISAPAKAGKSLSTQIHVAHMVLAGANVIVLDRENASWLYASRLHSILKAWGDPPELRERFRKQYHYIEFPILTGIDGPELAAWAKAAGADLVVFDSQRTFLTVLDLNENDADDYSKFMGTAIDPLFEEGITTLVLDNTGYSAEGRPRGSSAKVGLNEVLFTLKTEEAFSEEKKGRVRLTLAPGDSRLGNQGEWTMAIGGGEYEAWRQLVAPGTGSVQIKSKTKARKLILARVKKGACSKTKAVDDCVGKGAGKKALERAVETLIADGKLVPGERGRLHVEK